MKQSNNPSPAPVQENTTAPQYPPLYVQVRIHAIKTQGNVLANAFGSPVFFLLGEVIESGDTEQVFSSPGDKRTEDYITGRFG